jgi:centrosomal protein CEP78
MYSSKKLRKKNKIIKTTRSKTLTNFHQKNEMPLAIEDTKKYYQIYYSNPNPLFISQLKTTTLNIFLTNYTINDISVINKILRKYTYFKEINLAPYDPLKKSQKSTKFKNEREPITQGEKNKKEKEEKEKEIEHLNIINKITIGIGKHLSLSKNIENLSIFNFNFDQKLALNLSEGIINNKSIKKLNLNNCQISIDAYEILLKGLLNHEKIEYLNLSNNNFEDKYGNIIGRIISRQTYRRDQAIWLSGLRNEKPQSNEYALGLISINLNGNKLSSSSAECITTSLASDQYIRSITLSNNLFDKNSCKKFIYMLRRNTTLLNIDLRDNPGYDDNIKYRLVLKMSKNIKHLYNLFQKNVYSLDEYKRFKKYIDISFFDLKFPNDILKQLINNNEEITNYLNLINNKDNKDNKENNVVVLENKNNMEKENSKELNIKNKKENIPHSAINTNPKNKKKLNNLRFTSLSEAKTNKKDGIHNKKYVQYNSLSIDNNIDKKILQENLLLKRKIIEIKAKEIQNKLGKNVIIPEKYDNNNLKNNFNEANELLDKLNNLMNSMKKKNQNNINSKNNNYIKKEENEKFNNKNNKNDLFKIKENKSEDEYKEKEDKFNNIDYSGIF